MHGVIGKTDLSTHEKQIAHYAAVRARLTGVRPIALKPSAATSVVSTPLRVIITEPSPADLDAMHAARKGLYLADLARQADAVVDRMRNRPTLSQILFEVCMKYGVRKVDVLSARRTQDVIRPRQEYFYRARMETGFSLPQIARFCGDRDHTTALHGFRKHQQRMKAAQ